MITVQHTMKSWKHLFQAILAGIKRHDVRNITERDFKVGDLCLLQEWDNTTGEYTGNSLVVRITYITSKDHVPCALSSAVLPDKYGILSIEPLDNQEHRGTMLFINDEEVGEVIGGCEVCDEPIVEGQEYYHDDDGIRWHKEHGE